MVVPIGTADVQARQESVGPSGRQHIDRRRPQQACDQLVQLVALAVLCCQLHKARQPGDSGQAACIHPTQQQQTPLCLRLRAQLRCGMASCASHISDQHSATWHCSRVSAHLQSFRLTAVTRRSAAATEGSSHRQSDSVSPVAGLTRDRSSSLKAHKVSSCETAGRCDGCSLVVSAFAQMRHCMHTARATLSCASASGSLQTLTIDLSELSRK